MCVCDRQTARDRYGLQKLGVTHVLNAAEGERNSVCTGAGYYSNMDIDYYGIEADDIPSFNISVHFFTAAEYMRRVLSNAQSKKRPGTQGKPQFTPTVHSLHSRFSHTAHTTHSTNTLTT